PGRDRPPAPPPGPGRGQPPAQAKTHPKLPAPPPPARTRPPPSPAAPAVLLRVGPGAGGEPQPGQLPSRLLWRFRPPRIAGPPESNNLPFPMAGSRTGGGRPPWVFFAWSSGVWLGSAKYVQYDSWPC